MSSVPSPPTEYRSGARLIAANHFSTVLPSIDFETYSEAGFVWNDATNKWGCPEGASKKGLPITGAATYAEHPTAEVLTLSYDLKDGAGIRRWNPSLPNPQELFDHLAQGGRLSGWNVSFEYWIWTKVCVPKYGWPPLNPLQLRCAMAKSRAHAFPGALGKAAEVVGALEQKDTKGKALLDKFSVPRNPTKADSSRRNLTISEELYEYCDQDVRAESALSERLPDLLDDELQYWLADQAINYRGVAIDVAGVENCIEIVKQAHSKYNAELYALTEGKVARASELAKLQEWLHGIGVHVDSLDEEHLQHALSLDLPPPARRALEIRAAIGSAAVKKVYAMKNMATRDGRLHNLFLYHAARTGRCTGSGPQPTNLPNSGPMVWGCRCLSYYGVHLSSCPTCGSKVVLDTSATYEDWISRMSAKELLDTGKLSAIEREWGIEAAEFALTIIDCRSLELLEYYFGDALWVVSGCLRGLFVAEEGKDLICSDYSAIEAVVLAYLADVPWRKEVFETHGKVYEMSAAKAFGVSFEEMMQYKKDTDNHHPLRKKGKVLELALGYGGWIGAMTAFGADEFMSEDEMKTAILAWRDASPEIMEMLGGQWRRTSGRWTNEFYGFEGCAVQAVLYPTQAFSYHGVTYQMHGDALYCTLLSGRKLTYHRPRLTQVDRFGRLCWSLSYEGWNSNPKNGASGWQRMETYSGKLGENVCQATAADILRFATINLEKAGYPIVLHVYDEIVSEVPKDFGSIEEFEQLMATMPSWAAHWPIRATDGWRGKRYRK